MQRIGKVGQAVIRPRRGGVDLSGRLHIEGFVRPFLVEFLYEIVEAGLLLETVRAGRPRGLFLQGQMHALMAAVLLRMAWLDALDGNAQHQTLKNRILLENYYLPGALETHIEAFVADYNDRRYHEGIGNLTPADVYFGRGQTVLIERGRIKPQTIANRRLMHRQQAA
jgi:transposase InsO family protein